jgi:hypothetical protein
VLEAMTKMVLSSLRQQRAKCHVFFLATTDEGTAYKANVTTLNMAM